MNYILEIHSYCTTVVGRNDDGYPFLCRNADFLNEQVLKNATYVARFVKNGKYVYDAVMLAGCVGTFTAYKDGMFGLSINLRVPEKSFFRYLENIVLLFMGSKQPTWVLREACI